MAHESLTNQIDWAQAEAAQSRERLIMDASARGIDETPGMTMEEQALGTLFEAHGALAEVLKQHDDLERLAVDEQEMREVRERSKKDVRMDRNVGPASPTILTSSKVNMTLKAIGSHQVLQNSDRHHDRLRPRLVRDYPRQTTLLLPLVKQMRPCPCHVLSPLGVDLERRRPIDSLV